jgi:hypothetical protein
MVALVFTLMYSINLDPLQSLAVQSGADAPVEQ